MALPFLLYPSLEGCCNPWETMIQYIIVCYIRLKDSPVAFVDILVKRDEYAAVKPALIL